MYLTMQSVELILELSDFLEVEAVISKVPLHGT